MKDLTKSKGVSKNMYSGSKLEYYTKDTHASSMFDQIIYFYVGFEAKQAFRKNKNSFIYRSSQNMVKSELKKPKAKLSQK